MRILWVSNAPWTPGGYGTQADLFVPRLKALGHEMAVLCNFGLAGKTMHLDGIPYYPGNGNWANHLIGTYAKEHNADLVLILHDAWVMHPDEWPDDIPPVAIWAPVDHWPIPPAVLSTLQHKKVRSIAMSEFGRFWMGKFHLNPAYVPHGVDTSLFRPLPEIRDLVRDSLNIPRDAFLVGMVAANSNAPNEPDRKSFAKSFDAFWRFAQDKPDAHLYCHTQIQSMNGRDLLVPVAAVGIPPGRISFPDADMWNIGIGRGALAQIYQAFDVLLHPAMGEGFGIPILEAQACGVPVIVSDHSAMSELCKSGWLVDGDRWWDDVQKAWFFDPHTASIAGALEFAYEKAREPFMRDAAVEFAQAYDADRVTEEFWKPALDHVTAEPVVAPVPVPLSRAERRRLERANRKPAAGHAEHSTKKEAVA